MEGVLTHPPERSIKGTKLYVKTKTVVRDGESFKNTGRVLVSVPFLDQPLNYGDRVRFLGSLRHPTNFNNPGGFDYQRYLATRGIWATTFIDDPRKIIRVATGQGHLFWIWVELQRDRIRAFLDHHATKSSAPILKALILGERGTIPETVKEDFAISGAAHIMAISGLHLGIIAFFIFRGLLWVFRQSEWITLKTNIFKLSALLTIPPILLYTVIAGARVATVRATIMIIVYLVSILIDRPRNLYHTLALAALIITLIDPASLLEPSFQLSFTAVLAILYLTPKFSRFVKRDELIPMKQEGLVQWLSSWSRTLLLVSLAAIIGTGPFIAYHFNRFSPTGLISNFLVIPLLGFFAIPTGLFSSFISLVSTDLALPFIRIASWVVELVVSMIHLLASLPGVSFHVATPTVFEIALVYAFIAVVTNLRRSFFCKIALPVILCFGIGDVGYWVIKTHFNKTLKITHLDVGQGDSALIEFPGGKRALIDGGGFYDDSFDVGKNVIAPFLWKKKIQKIDYLVLTHPDPDHLNGLKFVARNFRVEELWDSGQMSNSPFFLEFMTIVKQKGIRRISLFRGDDPRVINGVVIQPLHPRRDAHRDLAETQKLTPNNRSLVLKLILANQAVLFTGDIEKEAEAELIASGVDLRSRVIKAPHHGSLTSSTVPFLERVQPEIALFSGRPRRFYRLPNKRVLERYERLGARVLRTDLHGAITIETDGNDLTIRTFRKSFRRDVQ